MHTDRPISHGLPVPMDTFNAQFTSVNKVNRQGILGLNELEPTIDNIKGKFHYLLLIICNAIARVHMITTCNSCYLELLV